MAKLEKIQLELAGKVLFCFSCALRDEGFHRREIGMGLGSERAGDSEAGARMLRGQQERNPSCHTWPEVPPLRDGLEGSRWEHWTELKAKGKDWQRMGQDHDTVQWGSSFLTTWSQAGGNRHRPGWKFSPLSISFALFEILKKYLFI